MGDNAKQAIQDFEGKIFEAHHPQHMWCGCIDGREKGGGNFKYADDTIRVTEIAAAFPPYEIASSGIKAKFSFRKIKDVRVIKITAHSDCGGAQTVIAYPDVNMAPDEDIANIVQSIADTGADLPRLQESFLLACEGNASQAANLLSRHIALVSLDNISRYPHINNGIVSNTLDLIPLYHDMKRGTGSHSHLERYDVDKKIWVPTSRSTITNMCERPHECKACQSCHSTISDSLKWVYAEASVGKGQVTRIEVPLHIATILENQRQHFQPELSQVREAAHIQTIHFFPSLERSLGC